MWREISGLCGIVADDGDVDWQAMVLGGLRRLSPGAWAIHAADWAAADLAAAGDKPRLGTQVNVLSLVS